MTRTLRTDAVAIDLGAGTWSARWPALGVQVGPFVARVHLDGRPLDSGTEGAWNVQAGDGYGRAGVWARWTPAREGPDLALHVPTADEAVVVQIGYRGVSDERLNELVPLAGAADLGGPLTGAVRLVNGYDSWSYAGVRAADDPGLSWWNAAFVRADQGAAVAVQALDATTFATRIASRVEDARLMIEVASGAIPPLRPVDGSWGYEVLSPPGLGLPVPEGVEERSPAIALAASRDPFAVVEELSALAGATGAARHWGGAPVTGWESWYHYGLLVDREQLIANAGLLRERFRDRPGFDLVQLDDGWQVTYGAWWPNDRFPADLTELTGEVRALGCRPGLWLAPFMVQPGAPGVASDHSEWMIRDDEGEPVADRYGRWSLDASNPEVCEWLRDLGAQVRAWRFEMVKLDFLYLGAVVGGRYDARVTGTDALRRGLRAMVDGLGEDVYVLGCGAPLLPVVGLCHGNRVGHDLAVPVALREFGQPLRSRWTGFQGVRPQARNVASRWALHRRWFDCDPDVVMAWGSTLPRAEGGYSPDESRTLATMAALCGGPFFLADDLVTLTDDERAVLEDPRILDLTWGDGFRPVDLFDHADAPTTEQFFDQPAACASVWVAERSGHRVAARFNWTDDPVDGLPPHSARLTDSS
jgi:alpha-galactosidase